MSSDDESDASIPPLSDIEKMAKGQNSITLFTQLPSFACSPGMRFDRWDKQLEHTAKMANWNNDPQSSMASLQSLALG